MALLTCDTVLFKTQKARKRLHFSEKTLLFS